MKQIIDITELKRKFFNKEKLTDTEFAHLVHYLYITDPTFKSESNKLLNNKLKEILE